jgi:hypothetical protein
MRRTGGVLDEDALRAALVARVEACWDRLDDAVSELVELHGVEVAEISARIDALAAGDP